MSGQPPSSRPTVVDAQGGPPRPPVAAVRPFAVASPHGERPDPYHWLRDDTRQDAEVLAYLAAENAYREAVMAPLAGLEAQLFGELRGRIKEDDATVPVFDRGYWYYTRYEVDRQHPIHARRTGTMDAAEEILLDGNQLAAGHAFYKVGSYVVSPNGRLLAWVDDIVGRNQFVLHIKDLVTGEVLADTAANVTSALAWASDDRTLFYAGKDPTTLRSDRIFRLVLGGVEPALVYEELDATFSVTVSATRSRRFVEIASYSTTTSETRLIDADDPTAPARLVLARERDHLYSLDHLDGRFVIRTNAGAQNFRLVEAAEGQEGDPTAWRELLPHRADALIQSFTVHHGFVAASVRTGGLAKIQVVPVGGAPFFLDAAEPTYVMALVMTPDPAATVVRYVYDSMTTPSATYEVDVATRATTLLKRKPVLGYEPTDYATQYLHATAADGVQVPISVVHRRDTPLDGTAPLLVNGYGSYGIPRDPYFDSNIVSLLDRGWVCAIAHVRGGQELGRAWYEDGKLLQKRNTFTDFIAATEHLLAVRLAAPERVFAQGGSAGGLLVGAVANLRPELFRGIGAIVPFVDVVTTMLDESIPLTTGEFDEWGDPKQQPFYDYMLSYAPYDNVVAQGYPSIYVSTGLWDSQVQYFEPAKWVARLRATKTDDNLVLLETDMTAGHGGASGRFDRLREWARLYAFYLHVLERADSRRSTSQ